MEEFIRGIPKAELHMHLEGSIEPALMLELACRNGIALQWDTPEALKAAYRFSDLQSFLDIFWAGCTVLLHEQDFYDMTMAYLRRAHADNVRRAELFLGLQNFTLRGIEPATALGGIFRAFDDAATEFGISTALMIIVQRHRAEQTAFVLLDAIEPWIDRIAAIGLGGPEVGNPPSKFARFFRTCQERGLRVVIHAGEEGPASYVREALALGAARIDHGNACLDDPVLVSELAERAIPLTVCPLSNLRLRVVTALSEHPLRRLMDAGLRVTVNSDDPSYFDGYIGKNMIECQRALGLSTGDMVTLARNSFAASFMAPDEKAAALDEVDRYVEKYGYVEKNGFNQVSRNP